MNARRAGDRERLRHLADAAHFREIRLRDIECLQRDRVPEVHDVAEVLARGNGNSTLAAQARQPFEIVRRVNRLLKPGEFVGPELRAHFKRLHHAPGAIGVEHDPDIGAAGFARGGDGGRRALVKLDVLVAARQGDLADLRHVLRRVEAQQAGVGGDLLPLRSAQQRVDRFAGGFSRDIPQRDVEARQREADRPVARHALRLAVEVRHDPRDIRGVAPNGEGSDHALNREVAHQAAAKAEGFAPACDAGVGFNLDVHRVLRHAAVGCRQRRFRRAMLIGYANQKRFNARDFHRGLPRPKRK